MARLNTRKLAGEIERHGHAVLQEEVCGAIREGLYPLAEQSIRGIAEACLGAEFVREAFDPNSGKAVSLAEAGEVQTQAFSNITGQLIFSTFLEEYNNPIFIGNELVTTISSRIRDTETVPGVTAIGDRASIVGEGQEYPVAGVGEDFITIPAKVKRGFRVGLSREAVFFDLTGQLVQQASNLGQAMGINKEKRILNTVTGQTGYNSFIWKGTAYNTYQASTPWVNTASKTMNDWTDIDEVYTAFANMTDPGTGEPITVVPDTIIVPPALLRLAMYITQATELRNSPTSTIMLVGKNPLTGTNLRVLSNGFVKSVTTSDSQWFMGAPKKAFAYVENWPIEIMAAAPDSYQNFVSDVAMEWKVSERAAVAVIQPRFMYKAT